MYHSALFMCQYTESVKALSNAVPAKIAPPLSPEVQLEKDERSTSISDPIMDTAPPCTAELQCSNSESVMLR